MQAEQIDTDASTGRLHCRFSDGSAELQGLGLTLRELQSPGFSPHFVTTEHGSSDRMNTIFTKKVILSMVDESVFKMDELLVRLPSITKKAVISLFFSVEGEAYPISGFPRYLHAERETRGMLNVRLKHVWDKH
jgi:hypothetical protein